MRKADAEGEQEEQSMKKNMLVFDTSNFTAPDSDGRPAVRVEEVEVVPSGDGVTDSIIVKLTGANTEANNRIAELEGQLKMADARNALLFKEKADAIALITELEARLKVAEKKFKDEREHSEWLQEECNKAVDEKEEANGRSVTLEAALREVIGELKVIEKRATAVVGLAAYEIEHIAAEARKLAQSALEPARQAEGESGVEG
jgi:hypothetical protein